MYCRMFSSLLGPYLFDASSISSCGYKRCLQTLPDSLWVQNHPLLRHISLENLDLGPRQPEANLQHGNQTSKYLDHIVFSPPSLLLLLPMAESNQKPEFMGACWSAFQGTQQGAGERGSGEAKDNIWYSHQVTALLVKLW